MSADISSREYARQKRLQEQQAIAAKSLAKQQREAAIREEKAAASLEQSYRLLLHYECCFRPLCREFMGATETPDPLHNRADLVSLLESLARQRYTYAQEFRQGYYRVILNGNPPRWGTGTGEGDTLPEAVVFALWELMTNDTTD